MENREEDEHFVHILKRDEEIDQISLNHQSRRSTGTSSGSKLTTAEVENAHFVEHTAEIHRAENFLDYNPERYSEVHEDSDDSFEKRENFHAVEKVVHYDPYTTKPETEEEIEEYQHRSSTDESSIVENRVTPHPQPSERHESPILEQSIPHEEHEYEKPRSRQHYSTVTVKASDLPRYENPPVPEVRGQITQSHETNDQQKIVQTPVKKEKNPYMAFDINAEAADPLLAQKYDLDDRDIHDSVQYLNTGFFEVFAEPSPQYHSIACVWTLSFKIFEIVRLDSFLPLFAFINIWIVRPSLFLARCALSQIITIWPLTLIYIVRPFFYSVGAIFSTARLHTSNGANIPEVWEKHVHIV
ncbi:unnamed protein product [Caenorhabditis angaria]|uniref:Uncharacterized protein n=1 Tax=Caenorhabditis angaria TaxID=860376 RepID=A0A9P1N5E0_9PELO|nr:unnamed protein product [Caenorhabditis angaria]